MATTNAIGLPPSLAQDAVLAQSQPMPEGSQKVIGYDWTGVGPGNGEVDYHALLQSYMTSGFQATNFGLAVQQVNEMVGLVGTRPTTKTK